MLVRVVDLETTGLVPPEAAVCEIGWSDLTDAGVTRPFSLYVDPGHPIPPETSAIHHIIDDDVVGEIQWPDAAKWALTYNDVKVNALAAHNAKFERQFLTDKITGGLAWICTFKCALRLWPNAPAHNNQALRYWRRPDRLERAEAAMSHRAGPDAYVTAFLLRDMLQEASLEQLIDWSSKPALLVKCSFGKHRGALWSEVPMDYLSWASRQDMDEDVAFTIRHEIHRRKMESAGYSV